MHNYTAISRHYQVERRNLVYLKFITEAHEGLMTVSTVEKTGAIVSIGYLDCFAADVESLLRALGDEFPLTEVAIPPAGIQPAITSAKEHAPC